MLAFPPEPAFAHEWWEGEARRRALVQRIGFGGRDRFSRDQLGSKDETAGGILGVMLVVAHNASFDRKFLEAEWQPLRLPMTSTLLCSLLVSRRVYPEAASHKLGALVEHLDLPRAGRYHRALADAEMTAHLWLRMTADIAERLGSRTVPLALMEQLQSIARHRAADYLETCRDRHGLALTGAA